MPFIVIEQKTVEDRHAGNWCPWHSCLVDDMYPDTHIFPVCVCECWPVCVYVKYTPQENHQQHTSAGGHTHSELLVLSLEVWQCIHILQCRDNANDATLQMMWHYNITSLSMMWPTQVCSPLDETVQCSMPSVVTPIFTGCACEHMDATHAGIDRYR